MTSKIGALVVVTLAVVGVTPVQPLSAQPAQPAMSSVTKEQFEQWMTQYSNWGRWGKDDQLGTLNTVTAAKRVQATGLVKTGEVVSLAHPLPAQRLADAPPFDHNSAGWIANAFAMKDFPEEHVMERQSAQFHGYPYAHIDGLCHVAYHDELYNGHLFSKVVTNERGCSTLAITAFKDGLVTRGVLIDMPGKSVTPADVLAWEQQTGITISPGDALFLRSQRGDGKLIPGAGYDPSLMPFLRERDVAIIGHDGGNEGAGVEGIRLPNHRFTLVALGMHLLDVMQLDALAATAAKLQRWEFLFTVAPPPVSNGSGAFVNPLAVF